MSPSTANDAFAVMRQVGEELRRDETLGAQILGDVEIAGIERWEHTGLVLRARLKVQPLEHWKVRAEFLRRVKAAFEARGIQTP